MTGSTNPGIDRLSIGLTELAGMIVFGSGVGRYGRSVGAQTVFVGTENDLLVS